MLEIALPAGGWRPRPYQRNLWRYIERGGKRAVAVWHRRAGKDELCLHRAAVAAHEKPATYWHMLPQAAQARKAIWDAVNSHTGIKRIDEAFPPAVRSYTRNNEMIIGFKSGATWQVVGSDNYNSLVGSPPYGVVFSEWALSDPAAWSYISPILEENGGWAMFVYTPRGRNHGKTIYDNALGREGWFAERLSAADTGVFSPEQLHNIEVEYQQDFGPSDGKSRFRQEYLVDFESAVSGVYYAHEMDAAAAEDRITRVQWLPNHPVHTGWDIGFRDSTCIWFAQVVKDEVRLLDYIENSGVAVGWYVNELRSRPYIYGSHLLPHDADVGQLATGTSIKETLSELGVQATIVPKAAVYDGINAVRQLLPRCVFDATKCAKGLDALRNYRREWDEKRKVFHDKPLHDFASHGCLVGETLVEIGRGLVPIKDVRVGDMAKTPAGWARITAAGPTKRADELVEATLADGRKLRGTPEHKVFTERGLVVLDALRYSDKILSEESMLWQATLLSSRAGNGGFRDAITRVPVGVGGRDTFIARFGRTLTAQFQRVLRSTISTATGSIMSWPTFSYSTAPLTSACTPRNIMKEAFFIRRVISRVNEPLNGTPQKRGLSGIASTAFDAGKRASGILSTVRNAAANIVRPSRTDPNSVTSIARWRPSDVGEESPLVFDLTVEKHHCYLANGILVSNSDAMRYLAQGLALATASDAWGKPLRRNVGGFA